MTKTQIRAKLAKLGIVAPSDATHEDLLKALKHAVKLEAHGAVGSWTARMGQAPQGTT